MAALTHFFPVFSPARALRHALMSSLYAAHRPELADVVDSAELALDFPGVWLRPADPALSPAWLEEKLEAAALASVVAVDWIRVVRAAGQGSGTCAWR